MSNLFIKFHQLNLNLIKEPNKKNANEFYSSLVDFFQNETINSQDKDLLDFILLPVLLNLKKFDSNQTDLNELLLKTLNLIFENFFISNENLFYDLLNIVSILLSKRVDYKQSEEFQIECLKLLQNLFIRSNKTDILNKFYKFSNLTSIGLLITLSLDILAESNSIQLRLEALNTLKTVCLFSKIVYDETFKLNSLQTRVAVILHSFLPGLSIKLVQKFLLSSNLKLLNHKLVCEAIDLFGFVLCMVLNDQLLNEEFYSSYFDLCSSETLKPELKSLVVDRRENKNWLDLSNEKLFVLVDKLLEELLLIDNLNVKKRLLKFCSNFLNQCYITLNKNLFKLFKIVINMAACEEHESLCKEAEHVLEIIENKQVKSNNKLDRLSFIDSHLEEFLIKLPRLNKELNDQLRLSNLKQLYGYLKLINLDNLNQFFKLNLNNLSNLIQGLLSFIKFDFKNLDNFYEIEKNTELNLSLSSYKGSLNYYLEDKLVYDGLSLICAYLGRSDSVRLIVDQLLNPDLIYLDSALYRLEIVYFLNLILNGLVQNKIVLDKKSILSLVLNFYLNQNFVDPITNCVTDANKNLIKSCLLIEMIRISSKCLEPSEFNNFLIDTLYYILENYLNKNLLVRSVSTQCLNELASNLAYKSIQDLLSVNFDYIINDLILKFNNQTRANEKCSDANLDLNKHTSHIYVLCSLFEISNNDLEPYLERLIDDCFFSIQINPNDSQMLLGVCQIMVYMSKAIRRWHPITFSYMHNEQEINNFSHLDLKLISENKKKDLMVPFDKILEQIDSNLEELKFDQNQNQQDEVKNEIENDSEETNEKEKPINVKLLTKCMQMCINLISHPFRQVRLQVIDLVKQLSQNLFEHTNDFLPLVHKLWAPICQRFSLDDLIVKSRIVYLLFELSVLCPDFISSRFVKEFLPRLSTFMNEQSKISLKSAQTDSTYIYSHGFKLQSAILSNIDKMCVLFEIKEMELENLIEFMILVYLDSNQPRKLQFLALEALKNCSLIDPDVTWLSLHYILPFETLKLNEKFKNFTLTFSSEIKLKYNFKFNDEILFSLIDLFDNI